MPPYWQFGAATTQQVANMLFFTAASSVVVWIASSYRNLITPSTPANASVSL